MLHAWQLAATLLAWTDFGYGNVVTDMHRGIIERASGNGPHLLALRSLQHETCSKVESFTSAYVDRALGFIAIASALVSWNHPQPEPWPSSMNQARPYSAST